LALTVKIKAGDIQERAGNPIVMESWPGVVYVVGFIADFRKGVVQNIFSLAARLSSGEYPNPPFPATIIVDHDIKVLAGEFSR
jgi:hypothetical protein